VDEESESQRSTGYPVSAKLRFKSGGLASKMNLFFILVIFSSEKCSFEIGVII
jgi:hypothetical protein